MNKFSNFSKASATLFLLVCLVCLSFVGRGAAACPATDTSRGTVTNTFSVPSNGQYRVWSRVMVQDTTNNSYLLNIDGAVCGVVVGDNSAITPNTWVWVDYSAGNTSNKIQTSLTAGSHTATLIGREDAVKVDRVIFTSDLACVPSGTGDNCASPPVPPTPVTVPYRLDAGGPGYTDSQGQAWTADKYYTMDNSYGSTSGVGTGGPAAGDNSACQTATINTNCTTQTIANTTQQKTYQTERWGDFHYDIPVNNGNYTVKLKFAEINPSHGAREFNVSMNGNQILSNFSIAGESGNYTANDKSFPVTITNGNLNLVFRTLSTTTNTAEVTGIEILPAPTSGVSDLQNSLAAVNGLVGSYFNNPNLSGSPAASRIDNKIDFFWHADSPGWYINKDNISARWVGTITAPQNGTYKICTNSDDGARLWINGTQLVDSWVDQPASEHCGSLDMVAGTRYPVKYEYYERYGDATAQLLWSGPGISGKVPVATSYLHLY